MPLPSTARLWLDRHRPAAAQALVPLIALTWVPPADFSPGVLPVLGLNAIFVALWLASALLFRHAGQRWSGVRADQ